MAGLQTKNEGAMPNLILRHTRGLGVPLIMVLLLSLEARVCAHGDFHAQIETLDQQIKNNPSDAELYLKRGELHRVHEDFALALKDFDAVCRLRPDLDQVHYCRGQALLQSGAADSAAAALNRFLEKHSSHDGALICRARARVILKQYLQAADDFSLALRVNPKNPELYLEKADALKFAGNVTAAVAVLDAGIAEMGHLVVLELRAADLQLSMKEFDAAIVRIDKLAEQSPRKESWLERRGNVLRQAGRTTEAHDAYLAALAEIEKLAETQRQTGFTRDLEKRLRTQLANLK